MSRPARPARSRLRRRGLVVAGVALALVLAALPAGATATDASRRTADWLALQVSADGSVSVPGETFSVVTQTMYVAQGLAVADTHRDALERAVSYVGLHIDEYVTNDGGGATVAPPGADLPERLASLLLLVHTVGDDPRAFGVPAQDLVARAEALYSIATPGVYGYLEPYSAVQDQSLMVLALSAVGATPAADTVQWIVDQQCVVAGDAPASFGGWMALRSSTGGVPDPCTAPDPLTYTGADTNSTAFAVQALVRMGRTGPVIDALGFLDAAQTPSGPSVAGFPWFTGGDADANSTALVIQAIVAAGGDPLSGPWVVGSATPMDALVGWQLGAPDDGALEASWSPGVPSLLSTYQGMWGLTMTAFPFPVLPDPVVPDEPIVPRHAG